MIAAAELALALERKRDELVEFVCRLIAHPTDSQTEGNPAFAPAAAACQELVAEALAEADLEVEWLPSSGGAPVVLARLRGRGGGRSLVLNGHVDVVPAGDASAWRYKPWHGTVDDGVLFGRGAADMKAGVAAIVFAVRALAVADLRPRGDVVVHCVSDEEIAGPGSRAAIERTGPADGVIIAEPTDLAVVTVEGGLVHVRIEVEGIAAHAGDRYASIHAGGRGRGVNAIEKALKIVAALQELEREWAQKASDPLLPAGFNTLSPGIIVGGPGGGAGGRLHAFSNPGTTPDYCSLEYNVWYLPGETRGSVAGEVERYLHHICQADAWLRDHPPRIAWAYNGVDVPPARVDPEHPLPTALTAAVGTLGRQARVEGFTAASELGWYAERGIPGVLFGPGRISEAHSVNEHIRIDDIVCAAQALALACLDFCNG